MRASSTTGYLAVPRRGRGPGVVVLHAWWGLTGQFRRTCDRLAGAGFVAYAPDLYGGETADTIEEARQLRSRLDRAAAREETRRATAYLAGLDHVTGGRVAAMGFSLGARFALSLIEEEREEVAALVLFYGSGGEGVRRTRAAVQGHFAERDEWGPDPGEVRALEERIRAAGGATEFHVYPGTQHWFCEQDRPGAYAEEAAERAWERAVEFLGARLSLPAVPMAPVPFLPHRGLP